jgi:hypothetical protein
VFAQGGERNLWCQDWEGRSPLHYAALSGDPQQGLYTWLIQQGAPTNLKDKVQYNTGMCPQRSPHQNLSDFMGEKEVLYLTFPSPIPNI